MEKIFIWGTGNLARQALRQCDIRSMYDVLGFIDNDPEKIGNMFCGGKVYSPNILHKTPPDRIVIVTARYEEIERQIRRDFPKIKATVETMNFFYKQCVVKRYLGSKDPEIIGILKRLEQNDLQVFNYDFVKKYEDMDFDIGFDEVCGMHFICYGDKRLYFARSLNTREMVADYYRSILTEQDPESPHKYMDDSFCVKNGDVVVDVGVAEGNFSIQIIEKVSRLYIIESDEEWIEALKETFKDYEDKVVIMNKFVTSLDLGKYARLDSMIQEPVNFIKMDIEGNEWDALLGAEELISRSPDLKCAICAYHGDFDEILIKDALTKYGMAFSAAKGYMWFPQMVRQNYVSTRLCRGIVRGVKK